MLRQIWLRELSGSGQFLLKSCVLVQVSQPDIDIIMQARVADAAAAEEVIKAGVAAYEVHCCTTDDMFEQSLPQCEHPIPSCFDLDYT